MKTVKTIKEDIAILLKELGDMRTLCTSENRDPNEDEIEISNQKLGKVDELERLLALEMRTQKTLDRTGQSATTPDRTPVNTEDERKRQEKRDKFASNGEFYQAVMRAGVPGGSVDPRLSTRAATGLAEGIPSDGGFLVDQEMAAGIMKNVWTDGPILPLINKITLSGNKNGIKMNGLDESSRADGSRAGGIRAYWKAEAALKTASKPTFRQIDLSLNKLIGLCYATDELLDDAQALAQTIDAGFRDEIDFKLVDAIINGTGAGQPLGILNSGCMVSITKETGQDADTIVYDNVLKMWSRLMASSRPSSVFIINQDCEPQLHQMSLAIGTGGAPVYLPQGGISGSPYSTLFGRPVIPVEQCPTLGDTGDIMLCDFSKYIAIDKGGIQADVSMHVQFIYDESVFRFVYRFDGQPMLASAITPFSGSSNTLSHFVKLNERA